MKRNQTGSVLAISLVLLTAITLIAMMGLQRSALQTKIVVNIQHKEKVFRTCANDQEDRFDRFNDDTKAYQLLFDMINNQGMFDLTSLDDQPHDDQLPHNQPNMTSTSLYIPAGSDSQRIALAVGYDAGSHTNHYFQNDSTCAFQNRPSIKSAQRTGFHFPALVVGQNSF
ncbi:MAG: hypothetical protein ACJAR6_000571 [Oleispira sp.]|jgi:hypothetical protein